MNTVSFDLSAKSNGWSFTPANKPKSAFAGQGASELHDTSEAFAADIARRISGAVMPTPEGANGAEGQENAPAEKSIYGVTRSDLKALEKALSGVIDKIIEKFGVKAGGIAQALVYKKIGDKDVDEKNLGDGLLDALKFIDQQFGPQEGDELIAFMNKGVNKELNAFFDNGQNEEFYVSSGAQAAVAGKNAAQGEALSDLLEKSDESGGATGILDLLKQLGKELEERLRRQMQKDGVQSGDALAQTANQLNAYAAQNSPASLASGMLLARTA